MLAINAAESFKLISDVNNKEKDRKNAIIDAFRTFFFDNLRAWLSGERLNNKTRQYSDKISFTLETSRDNREWEVNLDSTSTTTYGEVMGTRLNFEFSSFYPEFLGVVSKELLDAGFDVTVSDSQTLVVINPHAAVVEPAVAVPGAVVEHDIIFA